jgi:hypothetical protein
MEPPLVRRFTVYADEHIVTLEPREGRRTAGIHRLDQGPGSDAAQV